MEGSSSHRQRRTSHHRTSHRSACLGLLLTVCGVLGSVLLGEWLLSPLLRWLLSVDPSSPLFSSSLPPLSSLFLSGYYVLWVYPVYCLSFVLSALWYQDIADATFAARASPSSAATSVPAAATFKRWVMVMSEELYRVLLVGCFVLQLSALSLLPHPVGDILAFVHLCWLHALYSFDYKSVQRSPLHTHRSHRRQHRTDPHPLPFPSVAAGGATTAGTWTRASTTSSSAGRTSWASALPLLR